MRLVGRRWTGGVVRAMPGGASRFGEIRAAVPGVTDAVLATRLRELCAAGLATRTVDEGQPIRVEYRLTPAVLGTPNCARRRPSATAPGTTICWSGSARADRRSPRVDQPRVGSSLTRTSILPRLRPRSSPRNASARSRYPAAPRRGRPQAGSACSSRSLPRFREVDHAGDPPRGLAGQLALGQGVLVHLVRAVGEPQRPDAGAQLGQREVLADRPPAPCTWIALSRIHWTVAGVAILIAWISVCAPLLPTVSISQAVLSTSSRSCSSRTRDSAIQSRTTPCSASGLPNATR